MDKFNEEEYLESVAQELNDNCESRKKPQEDGYYNFRCSHWFICDVSLNISECKSYCYEANTGSCYEDSGLCDSCKRILEDKITQPFNKTKIELCLELIEIKKQLKYILQKIKINIDPDLL